MIERGIIEKQVQKLGSARAAGIHYRRSYRRAYGKLQRARLYSPTDVADHARLQNQMDDAWDAMEYIAKKYFAQELQDLLLESVTEEEIH